jgi:hypothetical protein
VPSASENAEVKSKSDEATGGVVESKFSLQSPARFGINGSTYNLGTKCGTNLFTLLSFCSMAQTVQKGHKSVASGSRRRQEDSSDSSPVPVPAKKTKAATARKSTGGKPPNRRQRDEVASAGPRGRTSSYYNNALFT